MLLWMMLIYHNKENGAIKKLYDLACHLDPRVSYYSSCIIGGMRFHIRDLDMQRWTQTSGILTLGADGDNEIEHYGILTDIIRLRYRSKRFAYLFKCQW